MDLDIVITLVTNKIVRLRSDAWIEFSLIAGNPLEPNYHKHPEKDVDGLTSVWIGQSAAKLRSGERSTTNRLSRCRTQVGSKWETSQ